jgi:hypothetical protein
MVMWPSQAVVHRFSTTLEKRSQLKFPSGSPKQLQQAAAVQNFRAVFALECPKLVSAPWPALKDTSHRPFLGYSCPSGGTLNGTSCDTTTTIPANTTTAYTCPSGGTLSGAKCLKICTTSYNASVSFSCSAGASLSGDTCYYPCTDTQPAAGEMNYIHIVIGHRNIILALWHVIMRMSLEPAVLSIFECLLAACSSAAYSLTYQNRT